MLVIGEIPLHFTNISKFESIGREQFNKPFISCIEGLVDFSQDLKVVP